MRHKKNQRTDRDKWGERGRKDERKCERQIWGKIRNRLIGSEKASEFSGRDVMKRWKISPIISGVVPVLQAPLRPWYGGSSLGRVFQLHLAAVPINQQNEFRCLWCCCWELQITKKHLTIYCVTFNPRCLETSFQILNLATFFPKNVDSFWKTNTAWNSEVQYTHHKASRRQNQINSAFIASTKYELYIQELSLCLHKIISERVWSHRSHSFWNSKPHAVIVVSCVNTPFA